MGSLLRKLKIKTEKRGHDNNKYLVLDNKIIDFLKKRYFPSPPRSQEGDSQTRIEADIASLNKKHAQGIPASEHAEDSQI